ncbi:MAG: ferrochelatase, partial [Bacteroidales bacterium]|nr:ferrochelatase [Bacteroidales bacterium]
KNKPTIRYIQQFYDHPMFINCFVNAIKENQPEKYDHVVFSYHGLPVRQINKHHPKVDFNSCQCHVKMPGHGKTCYKATCYETSRILANKLELTSEQYSVSFQSRLSNNWLTPFTDETLINLAKQGKKNVLVAAPAFVADCLETTVEIGFEYKELFDEKGGKELTMVESLNDRDDWVDAIVEIVKAKKD